MTGEVDSKTLGLTMKIKISKTGTKSFDEKILASLVRRREGKHWWMDDNWKLEGKKEEEIVKSVS